MFIEIFVATILLMHFRWFNKAQFNFSGNCLFFFILFLPVVSFSQSSYIPVNDKDYYHLIDRLSIKEPLKNSFFHISVKPIERKTVSMLADSILSDSSIKLSKADRFNLQYLGNDNSEWSKNQNNASKHPILKNIYKYQSDFFKVNTKDFNLHLNPVLYFSLGKESVEHLTTYINTRGIELRGMINKKVGFYTFIGENQAIFPNYVRNYGYFPYAPGVPGEGYTKPFKHNGVDFITARGYFTFNIIKNIQLQFGHDKNFIGNGYRSLILSDFSSNYTFLKINTHVWKINYLNLFTEMNADVYYTNGLLPKKYMALHHLSLDVTKNINIGVFESIIFGRKDTSKFGQFDFNYLNPIIFYRSIEQQLGSEDNALLGIDVKVNFLRRFSFYGQLILDEFVLKQVKAGTGWWDNKQGGQAGIKYIDVAGIKNLDLQLETNIVRPFTYSHKDKYRNYAHYHQPLAHPLGANFAELIGILRYQPFERWKITGKVMYASLGTDTSFTSNRQSDNVGQNIFRSYVDIEKYRNYGNKIGQGIPDKLFYFSLNVTFMPKHNLFIDVTQVIRHFSSGLPAQSMNTNQISVAVRLNIPQRLNEF